MKVEFQSKNEIVYNLLRKGILTGEYAPGTHLVIDQLAADLGVSPIPIREALRQLEGDGFITIEPYAGATVTQINATLIFEVFALLESLEVTCSRIACCAMTDQELERLALMIEHMDSSVDDPETWARENKDLHLFICDCARTTISKKLTQKVLDHWDRLRYHYLKDVLGSRIAIAQREHKDILAAFQARNPDEIEKVIHHHNQNALASYIAYLKSTKQITSTPGQC